MRIFRQLGSCGTAVVVIPLLWILACFLGRALAQNAYDHEISAGTRAFRLPELSVSHQGRPVEDPLALAELRKYVRVWSLEPGACKEFPDATRFPWSWNPLFGSATIMRLNQKQAFLASQHHEVYRERIEKNHWRWFIHPDRAAALGGRRFSVDVRGNNVAQAWEWK